MDYDIQSILEEMEIKLYQNYKRAMARDIDKPAKQWRELQILNLQQFKKENRQIIQYYQKLLKKEVKKTMIQQYKEGAISVLREEDRTEQYFIDKIDNKKLNALLNAVNHDFAKANQAVLRQINDEYRKNIFKTMIYYNSGTISLPKSVDMASEEFINRGLRSITYSDGKTLDICAYCDMALRTESHRAKIVGEATQAAQFNIVTCYVSRHGSSCPLCAQFEGLWLLDDVNNDITKEQKEKYSDLITLSTAMNEGLFHPNCRHSLIYQEPDAEGLHDNKLREQSESEKQKYKNEQYQRKLERELRKEKRKAATYIDSANRDKASKTVKELQAELRAFTKETGLVRRYDRENNPLTRGK